MKDSANGIFVLLLPCTAISLGYAINFASIMSVEGDNSSGVYNVRRVTTDAYLHFLTTLALTDLV